MSVHFNDKNVFQMIMSSIKNLFSALYTETVRKKQHRNEAKGKNAINKIGKVYRIHQIGYSNYYVFIAVYS